MPPARLKKAEKRAVATEMRRLLAQPWGWTKGAWHDTIERNGKTFEQRCLEGACNQAALNVLGEERAIELHAARYAQPWSALNRGKVMPTSSGTLAKKMSIARRAQEYALRLWGVKLGRSGMEFNDFKKTRKKDVLNVVDEYLAALDAPKS